jgi:uncharacterized membrane protein
MKKGFLAGLVSVIIAKLFHYIVTYTIGYSVGYSYRYNADDLPMGFLELIDNPILGLIFIAFVAIFIYKKLTSNDNNIDSQTNTESTIKEKTPYYDADFDMSLDKKKPVKVDSTPSKKENNISDLSDNLTKLGELKEKGLLTEEEFEEQKKKLLKQ